MAREETAHETPPEKRKRRWAKRIGWALAIVLLPFVLAAAFLSTPIGKRFVTDQIAQVAPASGLRFEVGRIEGDIYGQATLHDVVLFDPKGAFLTIPEVQLDWRPLSWLTSGLDIRELTARRGSLQRLPELLPGDPDAPILPDFDIRVDRFAIEGLTLVSGLAGEKAQNVDLQARADIRSGRVLLDADATLGSEDRIGLLLDAMPDGDRFDLALDYAAPADGAIAQLAGLERGYEARIGGKGTWTQWLGHGLVQSVDGDVRSRVAGFQITNQAGQYGLLGQVMPEVMPGVEGDNLLSQAMGKALSLSASGTLTDSEFDGEVAAVTQALFAQGEGRVDLAGNSFDTFGFDARLRDPALLGESAVFNRASMEGTLDGAFRDLSIVHMLSIGELALGDISIVDLQQQGTARFDGQDWTLPLSASAERVATGNAAIDSSLVGALLDGTVTLADARLVSDDLRLVFPRLSANLNLRGDINQSVYALAGPVTARGLKLESVGMATADAKVLFKIGANFPWTLRANVAGKLSDLSNETVANVTGGPVSFRGGLAIGGNVPLSFSGVEASSAKLAVNFDGNVDGARTNVTGGGRHTDYGPFTLEAKIADEGTSAQLVFADPLPAAGLKDVRVAIAPSERGFAIDAAGGSLLGPFEGALDLALPADAPAQLVIDSLKVWRTNVSGSIALEEAGINGTLQLAGGGLNGSVALVPDGPAQGFALDLIAEGATFGGATPIAIADAKIKADGAFAEGSSRINANMSGAGLEYGALFIGRFAARADVRDGSGNVTASVAGRRSDRFALKLDADIAPERLAILARGEFAGRRIDMPRRAVLTLQDDGGWRLAPTQVGFGQGFAIVEGELGGRATAVSAKLADMPLSLADLAAADLGFGGLISGLIEYRRVGLAPPSGSARVTIENFTRSGLVLSSRPVDLLAVAELSAQSLEGGAVLRDGGKRLGRVRGSITGLAVGGDLTDRLVRGRLSADLRYDGPAEAVWRLAGVETFDLTGPASIASKVTGTLADPSFNGRVSSDDLRVQSALSGTDIASVAVRGAFSGSQLKLARFAGTTARGGTVRGSGTIGFVGLQDGRGPQIDLRASVDKARLLNANGLRATLTGPLRIISNGSGGTIAGRLRINRASWRLGVAAEDMALPDIRTTEINRPVDIVPPQASSAAPWRYLVDASGSRQIEVDGLGLDSEWGADIVLRGTTDNPRIGGEARLVRGDYTFAGTRFELTRGRIAFDRTGPINPRLDIEAETDRDGIAVTVAIGGNSEAPEVTFASQPTLPEEEILARLLFGGSITSLSATDALQLGAALASLRGGGGGAADPIGELRGAIGLDQLRIVSADPALNRGTGVALGKNIGRRVYIEIVTDGRGYSATQLEYRVTRWLSLLGSVSSIGRQSVVAEVSRDY